MLNACMEPMIKTMARVLLLGFFSLALLGVFTTSLAQDTSPLLNSSKLEMFVDELLDMPQILGFDSVYGVPRSKSMEIGMYSKKWVSGFCLFLLNTVLLLYTSYMCSVYIVPAI